MQSHTLSRVRGISVEVQPTKVVQHIPDSNDKVS
jgi:hypothetical protein